MEISGLCILQRYACNNQTDGFNIECSGEALYLIKKVAGFTLYVVESSLLAARLEQWLRNADKSEIGESVIFTTQGPLFTADLNPVRQALQAETMIFPRALKMIPSGNSQIRKRLSELENLVKRATQIYWLSFPSPESELSFRICINFLKARQKSKRIIISSATIKAFRYAITRQASERELKDLYNAAYTRVIADAWFGMNVSFFVSGDAKSGWTQFAAGRIQWPVLQLISRLIYQEDTSGALVLSDKAGNLFHFYNAPYSWQQTGVNLKVESVQTSKSGNNLYTAESLIPELLTLSGMNHQTAVKCLHQLFEQGCITWPWTNVSWLPVSYKAFMNEQIARWSSQLHIKMQPRLADLNTAVYCLHPTVRQHGMLAIKPPEQNSLRDVYNLIVAKCLAVHDSNSRQQFISFAVAEPEGGGNAMVYIARYAGTTALTRNDKVIIQPDATGSENSIGRPEILAAMANSGVKKGQQKLWQESSEHFGLGRAANRNNILDSLIRNKYIVEDSAGIRLSDAGLNLLRLFESSKLFEVENACLWEEKLRGIETGNLHPDNFLDDWEQFLKAEIASFVNVEIESHSGLSGGGGYRNKAVVWNAIRQLPCPRCKGKGISVDQNGIAHPACGWQLSAVQFGRRISWNQLYILLDKGSTHTLKQKVRLTNTREKAETENEEITNVKGRLTLNANGEVYFQPVG